MRHFQGVLPVVSCLLVGSAVFISSHALAEALSECDRLAAAPFDPGRNPEVSGVLIDNMDAAGAYAACSNAHTAEPRNGKWAFQLGRVYAKRKNYPMAANLYREAADNGHPAAGFSLGALYERGGVNFPADPAKALRWYEQAARDGVNAGHTAAAKMLEHGMGAVAADLDRATGHWRALADKGDPEAIEKLRVGDVASAAAPPAPAPIAAPAPTPPATASDSRDNRQAAGTAVVVAGGVCALYEPCRNAVGKFIKDVVRDAAVKGASEALRKGMQTSPDPH